MKKEERQLKLASLWRKRNHGDWFEARSDFLQFLVELEVDLRMDQENWFDGVTSKSLETVELLDIVALEASFIRREKSDADSTLFLNKVLSKNIFRGYERHFAVQSQIGLNNYSKCDYWQAIKHFLVAGKFYRNDEEHYSNELNIVFCMELLGLEFSERLVKIELYPNLVKLPGLFEQLRALKIRQYVRLGRLQPILDEIKFHIEPAALDHRPMQQADYICLSLQSHPLWVSGSKTIAKTLELVRKRVDTQNMGYYQGFRVGTLLEHSSLGDKDACFEFWSDRFYQWTWTYLNEPTFVRAVRLVQCFSRMKGHKEKTLSRESYTRLELTLGWISLLLPEASISLMELKKSIQTPQYGPENYLLNLERALQESIALLKAGRKHETSDLIRTIKTEFSRLSELQGTEFGTILGLLPDLYKVKSKSDHSRTTPSNKILSSKVSLLDAFLGTEHSNRKLKSQKPGSTEIVVIPTQLKVLIPQKEDKNSWNEITLSLEEARFLSLMHESDSVRIEDCLRSVFNVHQYNPVRHDPKMSAFVLGMNKKLKGFISLRRKFPFIVIERENSVQIAVNQSPAAIFLMNSFVFTSSEMNADTPIRQSTTSRIPETKISKKREDQPQSSFEQGDLTEISVSTKSDTINGWLSRKEVEKYFSWTRSTAHRRLESLLAKGMIRKKGIGKSTRYFLNVSVIDCIEASKIMENRYEM